jgi:hypothetical protein
MKSGKLKSTELRNEHESSQRGLNKLSTYWDLYESKSYRVLTVCRIELVFLSDIIVAVALKSKKFKRILC